MSIDATRSLALEILLDHAEGQSLEGLLERGLNRNDNNVRGAFLAELVKGTVQWQGRYDTVIAHYVRKGLPTDIRLLMIFRLTLHQMLGLNGVPVYAAIHQAGELCKDIVGPNKVGFVNGVLQSVRRDLLSPSSKNAADNSENDMVINEEKFAALFPDRKRDPVGALSSFHSVGKVQVKRWVDRFGFDETEALCSFLNEPVKVAFIVLEPADITTLIQRLETAGCPVKHLADTRTLLCSTRPSRDLLRGILLANPALLVMDPTIQQATGWLLGPAKDLTPGKYLDMCASPGGKTALLADRLGQGPGKDSQTTLVAMDNRHGRISLLKDTLYRVAKAGNSAVNTRVIQADGFAMPFAPGSFAGILLDGPCSGTGVLRHHPDGRWRLQEKLLNKGGRNLFGLAKRAVDLLAPGGRLMYATCSLEREENEDVITTLLAACPDLEPDEGSGGMWQRTWLPHHMGSDGFFAARLRKKVTLPEVDSSSQPAQGSLF